MIKVMPVVRSTESEYLCAITGAAGIRTSAMGRRCSAAALLTGQRLLDAGSLNVGDDLGVRHVTAALRPPRSAVVRGWAFRVSG
jgi:hypothetical protein